MIVRSFFESAGPVKTQVTDRMTSAYKGMAPRKEELEVWGNLEITPQIKNPKGSSIVTALPLGEKLHTQGQFPAKITLELPAAKGVIALVRGRIDGITGSPVGRPGSPTLLQP